MNILIILLFAIILVAIAFAGFATTILIKKKGKFPNTHVSGNQHLKSRGIGCIQSFDRMEQTKARQQINYKDLRISQ